MDRWLEEFIDKIEMENNKHEIAKKIILNLQAVKSGDKSIGTAYKELATIMGLNEPLFPVYQKGTPVEWMGQGLNFFIMEDNGDYNALIATTMDKTHYMYNDWWVDKIFLKIITPENERVR